MGKFLNMLKSEYAQLIQVVNGNMEMKDKLLLMLKNKLFVGAIVAAGIFLFLITPIFSGEKNIDIVKSGSLKIDSSVTVGNALDNYKYFSSTSWKEFEDSQKRMVVEFNGKIPLDTIIDNIANGRDKEVENRFLLKYPEFKSGAIVRIQFLIDASRKSFSVGYSCIEINGKQRCEGDLDNIKDIYVNKFVSCVKVFGSMMFNEVRNQVLEDERSASLKKFVEQNKKAFIGKYRGTCDSSRHDLQLCEFEIVDITANDLKFNWQVKISAPNENNSTVALGMPSKPSLPVEYKVTKNSIPIVMTSNVENTMGKRIVVEGNFTVEDSANITYVKIEKNENSNPSISMHSFLSKLEPCNPIQFEKYD